MCEGGLESAMEEMRRSGSGRERRSRQMTGHGDPSQTDTSPRENRCCKILRRRQKVYTVFFSKLLIITVSL